MINLADRRTTSVNMKLTSSKKRIALEQIDKLAT